MLPANLLLALGPANPNQQAPFLPLVLARPPLSRQCLVPAQGWLQAHQVRRLHSTTASSARQFVQWPFACWPCFLSCIDLGILLSASSELVIGSIHKGTKTQHAALKSKTGPALHLHRSHHRAQLISSLLPCVKTAVDSIALHAAFSRLML